MIAHSGTMVTITEQDIIPLGCLSAQTDCAGIYVQLERNTQFGFSSVADLDSSSGKHLFDWSGSGRMVVQPTADILVGGSNPG